MSLSRAYLAWLHWHRRLRLVSDAAQTGFWLGLMDRQALQQVDEDMYERRPAWRSDRYNRGGLFSWEREAVGEYFTGCRSLLLVGAGGGREVLALAARGFRVEAFECNAALVEYAGDLLSREACTSAVRYLPRDATPPPGTGCDGAIVGWGAYMLIQGRERRIALLRGLRGEIPADAPILLSFWTREEPHRRSGLVAAVAAPLRRLRGAGPVERGDDLAPLFVHRFTREEVAGEMAEAGFRLVRYEPEGSTPFDSGWAVGVAA